MVTEKSWVPGERCCFFFSSCKSGSFSSHWLEISLQELLLLVFPPSPFLSCFLFRCSYVYFSEKTHLGQILKHSQEWRENSCQESRRTEPCLCVHGVAPASAWKVVTKPSLARLGHLAPVQWAAVHQKVKVLVTKSCPALCNQAPLSMGFSRREY